MRVVTDLRSLKKIPIALRSGLKYDVYDQLLGLRAYGPPVIGPPKNLPRSPTSFYSPRLPHSIDLRHKQAECKTIA